MEGWPAGAGFNLQAVVGALPCGNTSSRSVPISVADSVAVTVAGPAAAGVCTTADASLLRYSVSSGAGSLPLNLTVTDTSTSVGCSASASNTGERRACSDGFLLWGNLQEQGHRRTPLYARVFVWCCVCLLCVVQAPETAWMLLLPCTTARHYPQHCP